MSRKDYEAIAAIINEMRSDSDAQGRVWDEVTLVRVATQLGEYFKQENSAFKTERFLRACGW